MIARDLLEQAIASGHELVIGGGQTPSTSSGNAAGLNLDIDADVLRSVLLDRSLAADPRGLRLRGVTIVGDLSLDGAHIPFPISLRNTNFAGALWLRGSRVDGKMDLSGSSLDPVHGVCFWGIAHPLLAT